MDEALVKKKIHDFLDKHELAILSTIHAHRLAPESAIVGFGHTENLELIFGTAIGTRKYTNLQHNPNLALVIGWSSTTGSLQWEGVATELTPAEVQNYAGYLIKKNEDHTKFIDHPDQRYFLATPTWIRFYDNAGDPPDIYEIAFDFLDVDRPPVYGHHGSVLKK